MHNSVLGLALVRTCQRRCSPTARRDVACVCAACAVAGGGSRAAVGLHLARAQGHVCRRDRRRGARRRHVRGRRAQPGARFGGWRLTGRLAVGGDGLLVLGGAGRCGGWSGELHGWGCQAQLGAPWRSVGASACFRCEETQRRGLSRVCCGPLVLRTPASPACLPSQPPPRPTPPLSCCAGLRHGALPHGRERARRRRALPRAGPRRAHRLHRPLRLSAPPHLAGGLAGGSAWESSSTASPEQRACAPRSTRPGGWPAAAPGSGAPAGSASHLEQHRPLGRSGQQHRHPAPPA